MRRWGALRLGCAGLLLACAACGGGEGAGPTAAGPITLTAGDAELLIPAGALPEGVAPADLTIELVPDPSTVAPEALAAYRLEPSGLVFAEPAEFTYRIPLEGLASGRAIGFDLIDDESGTIEPLEITDCFPEDEADAFTCVVAVPHFSTLTATSRESLFSARMEIDPEEAAVGESVSVRAVVKRHSGEALYRFGYKGELYDTYFSHDGGLWWLRGSFVTRRGLSPSVLMDRPPRTQVAAETFTVDETFTCTAPGQNLIEWFATIHYGRDQRSTASWMDDLSYEATTGVESVAFVSCRAAPDPGDDDTAVSTTTTTTTTPLEQDDGEVGWVPGGNGCWDPGDLDLSGLLDAIPGSWTWTFILPADGAPEGAALEIGLDGYEDPFGARIGAGGYIRIEVPVVRPGTHTIDRATLEVDGQETVLDPDDLGATRTFEVPDTLSGTAAFDPFVFEPPAGVTLVEKTADTISVDVVWGPAEATLVVRGTAASGAVYDLGGGCTLGSSSNRFFEGAPAGPLTATGTHIHDASFEISGCPGLEAPQVAVTGTWQIDFDPPGTFYGRFFEDGIVFPFQGSLDLSQDGTCTSGASE